MKIFSVILYLVFLFGFDKAASTELNPIGFDPLQFDQSSICKTIAAIVSRVPSKYILHRVFIDIFYNR